MLRSFSEFKFYQSFRVPVEEADEIRFLVEITNENGDAEYIDDAKLVDVSVNGVGFTSKKRLAVGDDLRISIHFKRVHLDLDSQIVRSFSGGVSEEMALLYGAEFEEGDNEEIRRFLELYIHSFSPDRLKDSMVEMALTNRYSSAAEGLEMFSLLISLFKDMTDFAEKSDFVGNVLEEVTRAMNAQRSLVFLVNPETNELELYAAYGMEKKLLKFDYRKGIAGSVFTTGVAINLDALSDSSRMSPELDELIGHKTKSIICNPITNREDKVIGVVEVINKRNDERFNNEDEKTMKVVSLVFSSVFHNFNPISNESTIRKFSGPSDRQHVMIGKSKAIVNLRNAIVRLKDLDSPIYIYGEPGTGKSLFSRIIHYEGKRGLNPYFEINCGGHDEAYVEKMLLGGDEPSKLVSCQKGSVLIHEIHHLPLRLQEMLYQILDKGIIPGSNRDGGSGVPLDVRIAVTSTKSLDKLVAEGKFNKNLYEILVKSYLHIPPLKKREEDVKELINYFLKIECKAHGLLLKSFAPSVMKLFYEYEWPGNVKELRSCVERAIVYNPKSHVISNINNMATPLFDNSKVGQRLFEEIPHASDSSIVLKDRISVIERQIILTEIKRNNGNKSKAAREMGISREALRKKLMLSQEILDALEGYKTQQQQEQADKEKKVA
ncbi:MAG: sigma 54-interacting transcriptional regulator [Oligoflexia bacterium]|nr:sigma 54-interacting transcriptional regulator [Oligoflexia bacterium]